MMMVMVWVVSIILQYFLGISIFGSYTCRLSVVIISVRFSIFGSSRLSVMVLLDVSTIRMPSRCRGEIDLCRNVKIELKEMHS